MAFMKRLLLLFAFALAACGGGSTAAPAQSVGQCAGVAPPHLLYPQSGATGIAQSQLQLYFGYPSTPAVAFAPPVLRPNGTGAAITGSAYALSAPGSLPSGAATPAPSEQVFVSAIASYAAGTTYSVTINSVACAQQYTLGSFST